MIIKELITLVAAKYYVLSSIEFLLKLGWIEVMKEEKIRYAQVQGSNCREL